MDSIRGYLVSQSWSSPHCASIHSIHWTLVLTPLWYRVLTRDTHLTTTSDQCNIDQNTMLNGWIWKVCKPLANQCQLLVAVSQQALELSRVKKIVKTVWDCQNVRTKLDHDHFRIKKISGKHFTSGNYKQIVPEKIVSSFLNGFEIGDMVKYS